MSRPPRGGPLPPDIENAVHDLATKTFSVTLDETDFDRASEVYEYDEASSERTRLEAAWDAHEQRFETSDGLTDDETVEVLLRLGLDFTDERGQPLLCTKLMSRQAESAARGIKGRLPDRDAAEVARFERELESGRALFLSKKRKLGGAGS